LASAASFAISENYNPEPLLQLIPPFSHSSVMAELRRTIVLMRSMTGWASRGRQANPDAKRVRLPTR
jgi:hypothetical protein